MKGLPLLVLLLAATAFGQQRQAPPSPSVAEVIAEADENGDGKVSKEEAANSPRAKRQFPRWDTNHDGFATRGEIIAMRRQFGIDADGKRLPNRGPQRPPAKPPAKLTIPAIDDITRTDSDTRATREEREWSLSITRTEPHAVDGEGYLILTDHTDETYLAPLRRLAAHREGTILKVDDLAIIHSAEMRWENLQSRIREKNPRFVAIAPRLESYREKMLVGMYKLLGSLDDDPQLDVFPGLLVAPGVESFAGLIDRSIAHEPASGDAFQAFAQCHFTDTSAGGIKSLQKVGILREHFATLGHETPSLIVAAPKVRDARPLQGDDVIYAVPPRRLLGAFPDNAREALADSSLLVMFGHGSPGMSCGFNVDAFHDLDLTGKVVMAGSCWSAAPTTLDFPMPGRDAAGTDLESTKERFLMRAVESGAVASFGHMRLSGGFRALYPVLESWTEGQTVGEAYQRLVNALIALERTSLDDFLALDPADLNQAGAGQRSPAIPGNQLLYVIIGDPAVQPFEKLGSGH